MSGYVALRFSDSCSDRLVRGEPVGGETDEHTITALTAGPCTTQRRGRVTPTLHLEKVTWPIHTPRHRVS